MEFLSFVPHVNASLNTSSGVLLIAGFIFIQKGQVAFHRRCMLGASAVSALFLVSYLTHHAVRTYYFGLGPTKFTGEGIVRPVYFTILTSHTILAAVVGPFVLMTLYRGLKGQYDSHKKIARLVFPVWLYVSASGVVVYFLLYQMFPGR
ncbi:MAG: DUF420 domain-containing protein [Pyrinomonadaceae bacterium]